MLEIPDGMMKSDTFMQRLRSLRPLERHATPPPHPQIVESDEEEEEEELREDELKYNYRSTRYMEDHDDEDDGYNCHNTSMSVHTTPKYSLYQADEDESDEGEADHDYDWQDTRPPPLHNVNSINVFREQDLSYNRNSHQSNGDSEIAGQKDSQRYRTGSNSLHDQKADRHKEWTQELYRVDNENNNCVIQEVTEEKFEIKSSIQQQEHEQLEYRQLEKQEQEQLDSEQPEQQGQEQLESEQLEQQGQEQVERQEQIEQQRTELSAMPMIPSQGLYESQRIEDLDVVDLSQLTSPPILFEENYPVNTPIAVTISHNISMQDDGVNAIETGPIVNVNTELPRESENMPPTMAATTTTTIGVFVGVRMDDEEDDDISCLEVRDFDY
ncbi:hypothetical protein FBU30_002377 [Linnemannia zychae]|nr:hypothetical protein FBU30_002377 [Linnemannia zychae]